MWSFLVAFRKALWNFPRQDHDFKEFRGFPGTWNQECLGWPNPQVRAESRARAADPCGAGAVRYTRVISSQDFTWLVARSLSTEERDARALGIILYVF